MPVPVILSGIGGVIALSIGRFAIRYAAKEIIKKHGKLVTALVAKGMKPKDAKRLVGGLEAALQYGEYKAISYYERKINWYLRKKKHGRTRYRHPLHTGNSSARRGNRHNRPHHRTNHKGYGS